MGKYNRCPVCDKKGLYAYIGHAYKGLLCRYCKASWATHQRIGESWLLMPQSQRIEQEKMKYARSGAG